MLGQRVRQLLEPYDLPCQLVVACGIGLLLAVASVWLSPLLVLGALGAVFLVLAALKRPEIAVLGLIVLTSSIIAESSNPSIPIGIGTLYLTDIILLASFGLIVLRWLVEPDFRIVRTPLDWPLLTFYSVALLSTFIAILRSSLPFRQSLGEVRIVTNYLIFFIITNLVREDRQLTCLLRGLLLLATVVAVAMVAQYLLGESVRLMPGRLEALHTEGKSYRGITRVLPPGQSLVMAMFIVTTVTSVLEEFRPISTLRYLQWSLLGLALVLTFFRTYWVSVGIALLLLVYLVRGQDRHRLVRQGLVAMLLAAVILLPVLGEPESRATRLVSASVERLASIGNSETYLDSQGSLRWRDFEYEYALPQITSHPFIGLGLGVRYRPFVHGYDWEQYDGRAFIHNGHLWILVKSGLLGYLCLVWLSIIFLVRGFRYWRRISVPKMRASVLGFTLTYLGVLVSSIVEPTLMYWHWTPVIGMLMGINEVILKRFDISHTEASHEKDLGLASSPSPMEI